MGMDNLGKINAKSYPPFKPMIIYINLGVSLICGLMMSLKYMSKPVLLVYAGQLLYFAYTFYANPKLKYSEWHRIQIATRHVGCAGIYILYSSFQEKKSLASRQQLQRIGEILLGIYFFAYMYALNNNTEFKEAFGSHVPGGDWSRFIVTVVMATCSLGFITGFFVRDICLCSSVIIMFMAVILDGDFKYWTRRGVHYWNVVRMAIDSMCCVVGFVYFSVR
ncbi:hypothetical protein LOTGIDRAFT_238498, partial [Lottia gigantea]